MNGEKIIKPVGDLLGEEVEIFKDNIRNVLDSKPDKLIIDMGEVEVIDSTGIGVLVASKNSAAEKNCEVILKDVNTDIMKMFRIMRLNEHFKFKG